MVLITLSGGLQDAYSYLVRGHVFANAQTGNIVLLSASLMEGSWERALSYAIPVLSFILGILITCMIHKYSTDGRHVHWRQSVIALETVLLTASAFISADAVANAMISTACAMQVQAFRKGHGISYASTMCIGNLRGGTEKLALFLQDGRKEDLKAAGSYFLVILVFALGAAAGSIAVKLFGQLSILFSPLLLLISFLIMLRKPE